MNLFSCIIGKIVNYLSETGNLYREYVYNRSVVNHGGKISGKCTVVLPRNIEIGKDSYVNSGYLIASENARIKIGDNCLLSYNIHIRTDMHNYADINCPINKQGFSERDIIIKDDVWIGFGAQIMPGVTIERGCVIGAGAVVTHNTKPYGVYGGVPAKLIKFRNNESENS